MASAGIAHIPIPVDMEFWILRIVLAATITCLLYLFWDFSGDQ